MRTEKIDHEAAERVRWMRELIERRPEWGAIVRDAMQGIREILAGHGSEFRRTSDGQFRRARGTLRLSVRSTTQLTAKDRG